MFEKLYDSTMKFIEWVAVAIVAFASATVIVQVFYRNLFNGSFSWTEEFLGFSLVWLTFIGSVIATKDRSHLGVDLLEMFIPPEIHKYIKVLNELLVIVFLVVFTYAASMIVAKMSSNYAVSVHISMASIYSIFPIASVLMIIVSGRSILVSEKQQQS